MKNASFIFSAILMLSCTDMQKNSVQKSDDDNEQMTTGHSSENSLDWDGTYRGILPCENCEGLETIVTLNKDQTYKLKHRSIGKPEEPIERDGKFTWNKNGSGITLTSTGANESVQYFVGENTLTQLDAQGNKVGGNDASKHILTKANFDILEKYWKLVEVNGKAVIADSSFRKEPHFVLKEADSRVTGNGGCNTIAGTHRIEGQNHINLSKLISTKMFCPGMNIETEFLNMLLTADNFDIAGDTLILRNQSKKKIATLYAVYMK